MAEEKVSLETAEEQRQLLIELIEDARAGKFGSPDHKLLTVIDNGLLNLISITLDNDLKITRENRNWKMRIAQMQSSKGYIIPAAFFKEGAEVEPEILKMVFGNKGMQ